MDWYMAVLKKYADFSGRARRREYWTFALINFLISMGLGAVGMFSNIVAVLSWLYVVGVLIPGLAVAWRRLHDTGRSGWWILIAFIPLIGAIVLLVFLFQDSAPGDNQYGPNPKLQAPVEAMPA